MNIQSYVNPVICGTIDLKRAYRKNMMMALAIGISIHLAALGSFVLLSGSDQVPIEIRHHVLPPLGPPPRIPIDPPPGINVTLPTTPAIPIGSIPEPVADVPPDLDLPILTRHDMAASIGNPDPKIGIGRGDGGPGANGNGLAAIGFDSIFPPPDSFIVYDLYPEPLVAKEPEYPEIARRAGIEGTVYVRVLIDREGHVREACIDKVDPAGVGFEESAKEAAMKSLWSPAEQNDNPVPCWVTYAVEYKLD